MGFLNGLFLSALGAALLPIIIHLLTRRRVVRMRFSTLRFLEELSKRKMRRVNLRRTLVLLLRTLAVLFLVLAFARPTLKKSAAFFLPGRAPEYVVICVDVSYSMGAEWKEGNVLSRAKEVAAEIVEGCREEDVLNLISFASQPRVHFERGTADKELMRQAIENLALTQEATAWQTALGKAAETVDGSPVGHGVVYVVSDFNAAADSLLIPPAGTKAAYVFVPLYQQGIDNVSIDRVAVPRKLIRPGEVVHLAVTVTNHSPVTQANFDLDVAVEGERRAAKPVSLGPLASKAVPFSLTFRRWGRYHCRAYKNRDRLALDDERYFLLDVSPSVPVTLVRGRPPSAERSGRGSYYYLEKALNPRSTLQGEFRVRVVDESRLTVSDLPSAGSVVWTEPSGLDAKRVEIIEDYVKRGGGMMVFLPWSGGKLLSAGRFREFLGIVGAVKRESQRGVEVSNLQRDHPLLELFQEDELALLSQVRVKKFIEAAGVAPGSVVAYLRGGAPMVWEVVRGRGRVLVWAVAPELSATDLPLSPMFLPLVHTGATYLAANLLSGQGEEHVVGRPLIFTVPPGSLAGEALRVVDPRGESRAVEPMTTPTGEEKAILDRPAWAGFYRLLSDTAVVREVVVNVDPSESDLRPVRLSAGGEKGYSLVRAAEGQMEKALTEATSGKEIFAAFLLLAIAALVAESILGRRA